MLEFSYPNSDHARQEPGTSQAPTTAPTTAPQGTMPNHGSAQPADLPPAVREVREARRAESFFSAQNDYRDSGLDEAFRSVMEVDETQRASAIAEYKEIFADHDFSAAEARELVALGRELVGNRPDEATEARWQAEAWASLVRSSGGEKGAREALDLAHRLATRDPRMAFILEHTRLGNHPKVVELMVSKARSLRARGRL